MFRSYDSSNAALTLSSLLLLFLNFFLLTLLLLLAILCMRDMKLDQEFKIDLMPTHMIGFPERRITQKNQSKVEVFTIN